MFFFSPSILLCRPNIRCRRHRKIWLISTRTRHTSRHIHSRARRITDTSYSSFHNHRWEHQNTHLLRPRAQPLNPLPPPTLDIPVVPMEQRRGFDVRAFAQRWNLDGAKGGGAHMFREVWDEEVSKIYKTILGQWQHLIFAVVLLANSFFLDIPEPRFGRPQKSMRMPTSRRRKSISCRECSYSESNLRTLYFRGGGVDCMFDAIQLAPCYSCVGASDVGDARGCLGRSAGPRSISGDDRIAPRVDAAFGRLGAGSVRRQRQLGNVERNRSAGPDETITAACVPTCAGAHISEGP